MILNPRWSHRALQPRNASEETTAAPARLTYSSVPKEHRRSCNSKYSHFLASLGLLYIAFFVSFSYNVVLQEGFTPDPEQVSHQHKAFRRLGSPSWTEPDVSSSRETQSAGRFSPGSRHLLLLPPAFIDSKEHVNETIEGCTYKTLRCQHFGPAREPWHGCHVPCPTSNV